MAGIRILVVDDDADGADTTSRLLILLGQKCRVAYRAEHAIYVATQFKPEIILIDLAMPHVSGIELCRQLRNSPVTKYSFLVAYTGYGDPEHRMMVNKAGFNHYLLKPVSPDDLERLVQLVRAERSEMAWTTA